MPLTHLLASLLAAQAPVPPDQAALAQCLGQFVAARQQARETVADFVNAFASACHEEERAYRSAYVTAASARGIPFLDADSEAYRNILDLRVRQRGAYLASVIACAGPGRR
jgi:hypothetical protein